VGENESFVTGLTSVDLNASLRRSGNPPAMAAAPQSVRQPRLRAWSDPRPADWCNAFQCSAKSAYVL